ncbi:MAG: acetyl-CoA hydrolase/transferase family protein [Bacteroidetes bacterium]|nr:acetyl-CoA hydrolase/transferase family protein [Bacteroidota bacterium]
MAVITTAEEALSHVKSGDRIYIHTATAAPQALVKALVNRSDTLRGVQIYHLHTEGEAPYVEDKYEGIFTTHVFFIGKNVRKAVATGRAAYVPVFLSEIPALFRREIIPLEVTLITVSPPDQHGFCSLGTSVDATKAAIEMSELVIAQVNRNMPRTLGDSQIHMSRIHYMVEKDDPIPEAEVLPLSDLSLQIGKYVASLIENGATLQMGIGEIPNAVLASLGHHRDLGIHTEMFSDGILPLVESGVINGKYKRKYPGKIVGTFAMGSRNLYDFINDNPAVAMLECSYVNDTSVIRQNPKVTAINSAIEIDITGQVCADSIGTYMYSGVGGQMDFIRGASLSEGGKAIIALPSTTSKGLSRIVPLLKEGAGVVTTRAHIHYVVTEYGIAYLYGKDMKQRAVELIRVAHPDHREALTKAAFDRYRASK